MPNWKSKSENWRPKLNNKIRFWLPFRRRKMNALQQQSIMFQFATINRLFPSTDCRLRAGISKWLATPWTDFIPSWDRRKWNPFTAISLNYRTMRVIFLDSHELFSCNYLIFNSIDEKVFRNGLGTPTSNRRPSISTSREILHLTQLELRFRSIWRELTRETPWIWPRGNSRHRDREFIFSLSRQWRVLHLHLMLIFGLVFIWMGITSGRVVLTRITAPLINIIRWPSSRRWTWKRAINSGCRLNIMGVHPRICMTTVTTTPISRVSCWRRKLSRPFEVLGSTSKIRKMNVDTKIWGREF